ncbi:hypothetical protein ACETRX_28200 [Labrys portucalensis]|jgi:hypothetical protein|uniref:Uncharacterized protein n=2 Tax=Xanthobacteraceae TaxID=335928 RepID=A0ABV6ZN28_9HYPH|nr:MAG: hypothetical protein DI549_13075 [Ancylobacter novellus]RTL91537.1 hypothetical protein EJV44_20050 [Ancylobacter aquaticus]
MSTPDSHGRLKLSRVPKPATFADHRQGPVYALGHLRVMFAVDDIDETLERIRTRSARARSFNIGTRSALLHVRA